MRTEPSLDYYRRLFDQCTAVMLAIQRLPVPVIARVHGIATAAGCQLVAMCDMAVASRDARFAVSGINVGLFCSTPGVALSRNVPRKVAFGCSSPETSSALRGAGPGTGQPGGGTRGARRGGPESIVARIVAKPRAALAMGKALFYRQIEAGIEGRLCRCGRDDGGQHDGFLCTGGCAGVHRSVRRRGISR